MSVISGYFLALFLTVAVELMIAFFFGFRKKIELIAVICINLITNPILNYLLLVNNYFSLLEANLILILFLELIVVLVEWRLLFFALQKEPKKLLIMSFVMNFCSYVVGVLIFK